MVRDAHTPDQYWAIAQIYHNEQVIYQQKAYASAAEYEKYKTSTRPKTPTAADNARSWQAYYSNKAQHAGVLAAKYEGLLAASLQQQGVHPGAGEVGGSAIEADARATQEEIDRLEGQIRDLKARLHKPY
jgi:hypothetical protein